jgi:hypothetical protein
LTENISTAELLESFENSIPSEERESNQFLNYFLIILVVALLAVVFYLLFITFNFIHDAVVNHSKNVAATYDMKKDFKTSFHYEVVVNPNSYVDDGSLNQVLKDTSSNPVHYIETVNVSIPETSFLNQKGVLYTFKDNLDGSIYACFWSKIDRIHFKSYDEGKKSEIKTLNEIKKEYEIILYPEKQKNYTFQRIVSKNEPAVALKFAEDERIKKNFYEYFVKYINQVKSKKVGK